MNLLLFHLAFFVGFSFLAMPSAQALSPVHCPPEVQEQLSVPPRAAVGVLEDLRLMRQQSSLFLSCVTAALGPKGSVDWQKHPYALLADFYEQGLPYLDTSALALASFRRSKLEVVFDELNSRMEEFKKYYNKRQSLYHSVQELQDWLQSLREEASEQADGRGGYLAAAKSEILFVSALREIMSRQYRMVRKKLCSFKHSADQELLSQGLQGDFPPLPPQVIYCP